MCILCLSCTLQEAKQLALGSGHSADALPIVLAEPVLSEMRAKVADFKKEGWFMRYKLQRVKVCACAPLPAQGRCCCWSCHMGPVGLAPDALLWITFPVAGK